MSVIQENNPLVVISHAKYIENIYQNTWQDSSLFNFKIKANLFEIKTPYRKTKCAPLQSKIGFEKIQTDISYVQAQFEKCQRELLTIVSGDALNDDQQNKQALEEAERIYNMCQANVSYSFGENKADCSVVKNIKGNRYLFPPRCKFYCFDVMEIGERLNNHKYDLILLDPPWWNKYIRRKRKKSDNTYGMMYNEDLAKLPLASLLNDNGLVVVWCTNSQQHLSAVENDMFQAWKVTKLSKWYWLKMTINAEPICNFSTPPGKQPFEQIIFGSKQFNDSLNKADGKIIASVPSALHSHKPPLIDVLKPFLPENPSCLELFARYLLPDWTSYGLEVLKFQHESMYTYA